jgi:hypothetical protein
MANSHFLRDSMGFPWYIITGDINLDNFNKLLTYERGFIWRGFTHDYEMIPSAANYNQYEEKVTNFRTENCHPSAEIKRVAKQITELNKVQNFPFEIPLLIRDVLFSGFYQPEGKLFEKRGITEFPDSSLSQAMALAQHEFSGTSLLDFSLNRYKALYFAIGKAETFFKESHIFGLNVPYFETHKDEFSEKAFDTYGNKFDILYPSYFMNDKIARQEGVFFYQKFKIDNEGKATECTKYENIIEHFKSHGKENNDSYKEISLENFLDMTEQENDKSIFYFLLTVPAQVKETLKAFLNNIGITDNYMMNDITIKESKIENYFKDGDGI